MKIYFDTNIIIDILKRREPFYNDSNKIFMLAVDGQVDGIIGTSAITDIFYLLRKQYNDTRTVVGIILDILEIIKPVNTLISDIYLAAELGFSDFEDAVVAAISQRENADYILTRNENDFSGSGVSAITPRAFLENFKKV